MEERGEETEESHLKKYLFPYPSSREVQKDLIKETITTLESKNNLIVHAPTGLGKTAATLSPALKYALDNNKKVFFLTSRHTQHMIAIQTLKEIKDRYGTEFTAIDIIGKKWMCTLPGVQSMRTADFYEYCKKQKEDEACEQFNNTKKGSKLTTEAKLVLERLSKESPCHIERFSQVCGEDNLCAAELAMHMAKDADVIVADYYYIFNPHIRDPFLKRAQTDLSDCIVIVDEGHNLPDRIRNLMTSQLSNYMIKRAVNEAKKLKDEQLISKLAGVQDVLNEFSQGMRDGDEKHITKQDFTKRIEKIGDYDELVADLEQGAQAVRKTERQASLGSIAAFLETWRGEDKGYARILSQKQTRRESVVMLSYRCLDPSLVSKDTLSNVHSTIIMSGTLTPTVMYKDLLGFPDGTVEKKYPSPFPQDNRLAMIIPDTTTRFAKRNAEQYARIAKICAQITNIVPGNSALFFPSYFVRDNVYRFFTNMSRKTAFVEESEMNKEEKAEFLDRFKSYKDSGAVLLGVVSGSYGEGIDLPGELLKCVVVVGLPLQQPNLETKALIKYYDEKFGKGWDYGYVGPAFSKTLQSAGRCIRSESDRGTIVFLDERYIWPNYFRHFPIDWHIEVTRDYASKVSEFFQ